MTEIKSLSLKELGGQLALMGEKPYRAGQIFKWLHEGAQSFEEMSNLPKSLRLELGEKFLITRPKLERKQASGVDGTVKYLWRLRDGLMVESVLMRYEHGISACISTQAGCRMGCVFCASGQLGLERNLSAGEMLDEVLYMQKDNGSRISSLVLMGAGEPLDNYENVTNFVRLISSPEGFNLGQRHISLSTSGIADKIDMLAEEKFQITLSVSLHAPDDKTRSELMPVNRSYPVARLMKSCRYYFETTGRRISYEYMMAKGKTDRLWQAQKLAELLKGTPSHVNLIQLNRVKGSPLSPSARERTEQFKSALERPGITVTVRRKMGPDIDAACGQLRLRNGRTEASSGGEWK